MGSWGTCRGTQGRKGRRLGGTRGSAIKFDWSSDDLYVSSGDLKCHMSSMGVFRGPRIPMLSTGRFHGSPDDIYGIFANICVI